MNETSLGRIGATTIMPRKGCGRLKDKRKPFWITVVEETLVDTQCLKINGHMLKPMKDKDTVKQRLNSGSHQSLKSLQRVDEYYDNGANYASCVLGIEDEEMGKEKNLGNYLEDLLERIGGRILLRDDVE
ncbi:hypothetical protein M9H77_17799 [Catharanthus roseus]|uniref:Uncharacterized protein n=1 Tax=Catharanthus roseus TaxID=4058 RepID=A0ACC0B5N2_CATRO|nr:hypothetical protein M9H77_17799 [Catharanthus roseus]